jgi:hypothetical protein
VRGVPFRWRKALAVAGIAAFLAAAEGCGNDKDTITWPPINGTPVLVSFQDGVYPDSAYSGTRDAFLKEAPAPDNDNFGHMCCDTVGSLELLPWRFFERRFIVRTDLTSITDCSSIIVAVLYLHVSQMVSFPADTVIFEACEVTVPEVFTGSWLEGEGGTGGGVSWACVDGEVPWDSQGGDIIGTPLDSATVAADSVISFVLPNALVFRWIEEPETNHGVLIKPAETGHTNARIFHTRESPVGFARPRLEIEYLSGG